MLTSRVFARAELPVAGAGHGSGYRPELDGLRAVAVVSVVLFHAGANGFEGGYVGVDVFFVISGYLIARIVVSELDAGTFSLRRFYERRARRILPALFATTLACLPFAWLWLTPRHLNDFGQSLVAVATFGANLFFWHESGYFDAAADLKPLLHTWSLALEEQYYLLFPPLLLLLARRRASPAARAAVLGGLLVVGLALAEQLVTSRPAAAFYLLPTRAWEFLVGALAALSPSLAPRPGERWPGLGSGGAASGGVVVRTPGVGRTLALVVAPVAAPAGVALIAGSVLLFDTDTPFPGLRALVPTLGTALVVLFVVPGSAVHALLSSRPLVATGLASYSAYLVHQPLFAFARHRSLEGPEPATMLALCLAIVPLAWVGWRYVETPFRSEERVSGRRFAALAVGTAALLVGVGVAVVLGDGRTPGTGAVGARVPTVAGVHCHNQGRRDAAALARGDVCTAGGADIRAAVLGDSHAGTLFDALGALGTRAGAGYWAISGGFCVPALGFSLNGRGRDCTERTEAAVEAVAANGAIEDVVLVAQWSFYADGFRDGEEPVGATLDGVRHDDPAMNPGLLEAGLRRAVERLVAAGKRVFVLEPTPEFDLDVLDTLAKARRLGLPTGERLFSIPRSAYEARGARSRDILARLGGVRLVRTADLFCDERACRALDGTGRPLFSDTNHLAGPGASRVAERIRAALAERVPSGRSEP